MASNVTPSIPGAPLLLLAIRYASWSVSILQTWTYSPQKRQVGSAFALTYRLLRRSCKLMGVFVISPLPSLLLEPAQQQGRFAPRTLLRFIATTDPAVTLSPFHRLPVVAVIRLLFAPPISRRGEEGFSSCSAHPCHRAVATTPPEWSVASVRFRQSILPSPHQGELDLRG